MRLGNSIFLFSCDECGLWIAGIVPVFFTDLLPSLFQDLCGLQDVGIIPAPDRIVPVLVEDIL